MGAAGWTRDGHLKDFIQFGVIFGTCVYYHFEFKKLKMLFFVRARFQVIFLSISESKSRRLGLSNRGFRIECIAKIDVSPKSFLMNLGTDLCCFFGSLGSHFSGFLGLENRFEYEHIFSDETDPE